MDKPTETGSNSAPPVVYTAAQAAAILGIKTATLTGYIHAGKIEGFRVGTRWRVTADALNRYITRYSCDSARPARLSARRLEVQP
jgi:excisionase family DNA binding protein